MYKNRATPRRSRSAGQGGGLSLSQVDRLQSEADRLGRELSSPAEENPEPQGAEFGILEVMAGIGLVAMFALVNVQF